MAGPFNFDSRAGESAYIRVALDLVDIFHQLGRAALSPITFDLWRHRCYRFRPRETQRKAWVRLRASLLDLDVPGADRTEDADTTQSPLRLTPESLEWAREALGE